MKNVPVCLYTTTGFATQTAKPLAVFFFFSFSETVASDIIIN